VVSEEVLAAWQVVRVPFPFTDLQAVKNRPALVLSDAAAFNAPAGHAVMAMITSEANSPWPLDCPIFDLAMAGLPAPSKVRFKLFTLDRRLVRGVLGQLAAEDKARVSMGLARLLADGTQRLLQEARTSYGTSDKPKA
jgi:mRNA interferase MazF